MRLEHRPSVLPWRHLGAGLAMALCIGVAFLGWVGRQAAAPLNRTVTFEVRPGQTLRTILDDLATAGCINHPQAIRLWARLTRRGDRIVAGEYAIAPGTTLARLLGDFAAGRVLLHPVRIPEGATFRDALAVLWASPTLTATLRDESDSAIMDRVGAPGLPAEGWFLPDTYFVTRGETDLDVLRRSHAAMQDRLDQLWQARGPGAPDSLPDALTLASLVEKETGRAEERPLVASVLLNRLRLGMPLQVDSTVIYGLGDKFDGNLRRSDLLTPTPHNTYTQRGLPPTPIALPSTASLTAVLHPAAVDYLYFVARGDGSHVFSRTLAEHNRAVNCYQRHLTQNCPS
jgi:UPF0755 protein